MNVELLREKIRDTGITMTALARKSGMTRETLYNKLNGSDFKVSEAVAIAKILHMTPEERELIFFNDWVN